MTSVHYTAKYNIYIPVYTTGVCLHITFKVQPLSPFLPSLPQRMLLYEPSKRISAMNSLNHAYFKNVQVPTLRDL